MTKPKCTTCNGTRLVGGEDCHTCVCTASHPVCLACVQAAGMRPRVIFVTDTDPEALRLRRLGAEHVKRLLCTKAYELRNSRGGV